MGLSNTAVPKYYGEFRDAVLAGEIPVCYEISLEMNRIDALIEHPGVYYDEDAVEGYIKFCENELTLTDGSDLNLLDTFKVWAEQIYGWYYFVDRSVFEPGDTKGSGKFVKKRVKRRLTKKQYLVVARGAAKSLYASTIQDYELNVNPLTSHQITTAPTMKQAEEVVSPIRTAISRAKGPLFKFLTAGTIHNTTGSMANRAKLASTKIGIQNFITGSWLEIRPMRIDKLQGLRCRVATIDEWLSGDIKEDVMGAIEQGASKLDDYLIVATSSEGTVRNSIGDEIKMELMSILKGDYENPHVSIWHYKLDDIKEVADPEMWIKAQPNIGKTVTYEVYHNDVERAEANPSARNDILAKRFGLPMEGYTYFFTYEETKPHKERSYRNMSCAMGIDLSRGDDFCSFDFLFPLRGDEFANVTVNFITAVTYFKLPETLRQKYDQFIKEGSLYVLESATLDMREVYDEVINFIDHHQFNVLVVGYDRYNSDYFINRWILEHGDYGVINVPQGYRTESVPLGEIKQYAEERSWIFDQEIYSFCMGNSIVLVDNTNGNRKLYKNRAERKIDAVASSMDAYVAYKTFPEAFE